MVTGLFIMFGHSGKQTEQDVSCPLTTFAATSPPHHLWRKMRFIRSCQSRPARLLGAPCVHVCMRTYAHKYTHARVDGGGTRLVNQGQGDVTRVSSPIDRALLAALTPH